MIERKGRNIESGAIVIAIDNRKVHRELLHEIIKSNQAVQDVGAEVMQIKRLLQKIKFKVEFKLKAGYPKNKLQFENDSRGYLMA